MMVPDQNKLGSNDNELVTLQCPEFQNYMSHGQIPASLMVEEGDHYIT